MYFTSRREAGEKLAKLLEASKKAVGRLAVVALSDGAVPVAKQIASHLKAPISVLVSRPIRLPTVGAEEIGSVGQDGSFTVSGDYSAADADELQSEFHGFIEEEKIRQMHIVNNLLGEKGVVSPDDLRGCVIIAVSDGLPNGSSLDALTSFLKPVRIAGLIAAVPVASVQAVDRMHILFDELHCLNVTGNYISTDHYYNNEPALQHEEAMQVLQSAANN